MADLLNTATTNQVASTTLKNRHIEEQARSLMFAIRTGGPSRTEADDWHDLVELVRQPVLSILKYVFGAVNTEDQRDLFQEVMLRFYRSRDSYDLSRPLLPWLYTIARNVKREWMEKSRPREQPAPAAQQPSNDNLTPNLAIMTLFAKLPEEDRHILWLSYFEGLTDAEISEHLNIPLSTTKFYLRRAKERGREILGAPPGGETHEA